ncbi:MAG: penicillin-binding protein 2 [Candidatus Peregrinibacteria bacterium]
MGSQPNQKSMQIRPLSVTHRLSAYGVVRAQNNHVRIIILLGLTVVLFFVILGRLFQLQILNYSLYSKIAEEQHFGAIELPARRGEILVRDTHSGELSKLATNTTLDLLYVDPMIADEKSEIAKALAPLLFTKNDYEACLKKPEECQYNVIEDDPYNRFTTTQPVWDLGITTAPIVANQAPGFKPYETLTEEASATILRKISKLEVDFSILKREADTDLIASVVNERLPGIFADPKRFMIYADPTLIPENRVREVAQALSGYLDASISELETQLSRRKVRYVFLKNKLDPAVSRQIRELKLEGVVLIPEHWRFYPENALAAHLLGFINRDGAGQYGIEGFFNKELEGKKGTIYAGSDPFGRQITVDESKIVNAVDGDTVVLTIDRVVQKKVEEILAKSVEDYKADSGQVILMNPFTGAILAMASFPTFNPNHFSDAFTLKKLEKDEKIYPTIPVFTRNEKGAYLPATPEELENPDIQKYVYENKFGPGVFKNKTVSDYYEPGSVFKPIVMGIALDSKEVEPNTTFFDDGPVKIDEFEIKNSDNVYHGKMNMIQVLEYSLNTGMSWVAKKLGKQLTYQYLKDFGFGDYTNIQLEGETPGKLDYYTRWSRAQLLTTSFGQGIIVTPLQLIAAWGALANGGKLMEPYIVDSVIKEKETIKTEPKVLKRVIAEETSSILTSMLITVVQRGQARKYADIPGFLVAAKTGTSQIAGKNGKYETGEGSVNTSFVGYMPALKPKFVMVVKFDRPRIGDNTWGVNTAAPTFRKIADYLIDYYNLQPSN